MNKGIEKLRQFTREQLVQLAINLENFQDAVQRVWPQACCKVKIIDKPQRMVVFKTYLPGSNVPCCPGRCVRSTFWANFSGHPWSIEHATRATIKW